MPRGGGNSEVGPVRTARNQPDRAPHRRERRCGESGGEHGRALALRARTAGTRPIRRRVPRAGQLIHGPVPVPPSAPRARVARPDGRGEPGNGSGPQRPPQGWTRRAESTMPEVSRKSSGAPGEPPRTALRWPGTPRSSRSSRSLRTHCNLADDPCVNSGVTYTRTWRANQPVVRVFRKCCEQGPGAASLRPPTADARPTGRASPHSGRESPPRRCAHPAGQGSVNDPPRAASSSRSGAGRKRSPFSARSAVSRASTRASPRLSAWRSGPP
jgi:hypothetical protein